MKQKPKDKLKELIKETKEKVEEQKKKYYSVSEKKGIDIDKDVEKLFDMLSYESRILFWYWYHRTMLWSLEFKKNEK